MEGLSRRISTSKNSNNNHNAVAMLAQILEEYYNVIVVITYRHYFDWLPSLYYQEQREAREAYDKRLQQLIQKQQSQSGKVTKKDRPAPSVWIPASFQDFLKSHLQPTLQDWKRSNDKDFLGDHLSVKAFRMYAKDFSNPPIVFDFHQPPALLATNFVCQTIPTAVHTCQFLQELHYWNETDTTRDNAAHMHRRQAPYASSSTLNNMDRYRLLEASLQANLTQARGRTTFELLNRLETFMELERQSLKAPASVQEQESSMHTCLSPNLADQFLLTSIGFEQELITLQQQQRGRVHSKNVTAERMLARSSQVELFRQHAQEGKFCELDPVKVLRNETWREMLLNL